MDSLSRGARSGSNTFGGPESAVIGELVDGRFFPGKFGTHHVKSRLPTGGGEVSEDLFAVRQVHECSAGFVLEITVAELKESGVLLAAGPAQFFEAPEGAFGGSGVAVVSGE